MDGHRTLTLDLEVGREPIAGWLREEMGRAVPFAGWLELAAALERVLAARPLDADAPAASDGRA